MASSSTANVDTAFASSKESPLITISTLCGPPSTVITSSLQSPDFPEVETTKII